MISTEFLKTFTAFRIFLSTDLSIMTEVQLDSPGVTQVVHLQEGAKSVVDSYSRFYNSFNEEKRKEREENSRQIAESFYELVTDFYEFGYGRSFHFAPVYDGKSNEECIEKYEREVARALDVKPGDRILVSGFFLLHNIAYHCKCLTGRYRSCTF